MNKYELALFVSGIIEEEERKNLISKIQSIIERFEGKITEVDDWGKRKLAYEINHKGKKATEGFLSFTTFEASGNKIVEIENRIRIIEDVLRYLIVRKEA